jgi:hypothetical protein
VKQSAAVKHAFGILGMGSALRFTDTRRPLHSGKAAASYLQSKYFVDKKLSVAFITHFINQLWLINER